jgi:hypothetical protein
VSVEAPHKIKMLELMAYINTSGRPSRRECSECCDSDIHGAGIYWLIGVIKFTGGTIRLWGCGTGVRGYFRDYVQFRTESVQVSTVPPYGIHTVRMEFVCVGFWVFSYIYIYISD